MEIIDSRVDLGFFSGEHRPAEVMRSDEDDEDELVEVLLVGGSPWGFTLRGGLEYNEPLLITKVEDGSRAALGRLQIGDEIISVNSVLLNGYRLEAVGLVKSSQTTLTLGIKRTRFHDSSFGAREFVFPPDSWWAAVTSGLLGIARPGLSRWPESPQRSNEPRKIKMVDIVTQTMPAESEVHVARNFLTKILRSSMRKNRYKGRTESSCRPHSWHSAKSTENSTTTDVPKSEPSAAPEPAWQTKYNAGSPSKDVTSCWGQTNLRQVSCQFSSVGNMESVEPSPHAFSKEPLFPNKPNGGADHSTVERAVSKPTSACSGYLSGTTDHNTSRGIPPREGMFYRGSPNDLGVPSDCHRYLQIPIGNGGRVSPSMEELAGSKFSTGRSNHGPVWHIPEKNTLTPAAPPPPLRSDSFTATRVHEKSLVGSFPEGPSVYPQQISHCKAVDRTFDDHHVSERGHESRRSYNPPSKKDFLHPYLSVEDYNPNQLNPNKLFSLSSTDIRQGQNPFMYEPQHQRQHSDESPFSMYPKTASTPKMQSVGTYYRSLQDLPTNTNNQNQARTSTGSLSSTTFDPNHEGQAHFRYYCITAQQPSAESSTSQKGWMVDEQSLKMGNSKGTTDKSFVGSQKIVKMKYPHPYLSLPDNKNSNGYCKQTMSPSSSEAATPGTKQVISKYSTGEREKESQRKRDEVIAKHQPSGHVPKHQTEQKNPVSTFHRDNPWINKQDQKICPQKTPMLHSLAQESKKIADKLTVTAKGGHQESTDSMGGKQGRRSDRYATTLRNEIQQKKAQLQKSRSAATLTCPSETEEDHDVWKSTETSASSSDGSFTNTYKDHLKEAQAKVLKATSFMRKDLELPGNEGLPGQPSIRSGPSHGQVTRIGGRKRFPMDKKLRSFSEPDKINEIGVEDKPAHPEDIGSFVDRYKFFEGSCKPTLPKRSLLSPNEDHNEGKTELTGNGRSIHRAPFKQSKSSHCDLNSEEQQRLGTFAEYEATWNLQKKPLERRTTGRYHSAENILDSGSEESSSTVCIHERSRSSPSADFYGKKILLPPREFAPESPSQPKDQQESSVTSVSVKEHSLLSISEPLELITQSVPENKPVGVTLSSTQRPRPDPLSARHLQVSEQLHPKNKEPETHQPAQPRVSKPAPPQTTCPSRTTQEEQTVTRVISAAGTRSASPNSTRGPGKHSPSPSGPLERNMLPAAEPENDQQSQSRGSLPLKSLSGTSCISPDLTITSAERTRSPSPQFVPQKLTDEPPATLQIKDPHSYKMEETPNTAGRKVPVQIVCAESISERENRNHLLQPEPSEGSEVPNHTHLKKLDDPEPSQPRSSTCAHQNPTRNSERSSSEHQTNTETTIKDTGPVRTSGVSERSEEDLKREELARDIMGRDKSLVDILDQSKMKTTMDLMKGIFPQGEQVLEGAQQRRKAACKQTSPKNTQNRVEDSLASSVSLVSSSTYYSTSAPKAELLIKMKDMQEHMQDHESEDDEQECDLANKKQELIDSLSKKLQVLRDARESLQEDVHDNNVLGEEVEATVQSVCRPNELQKFRMFVGDLDKVVSLLLSLSGRLARVENALNNLEEGTPAQEKNTLTEKRNLLIQQHEDAKELKENLDRRERAVYDILASYLSEERLADYQHFVKMKSALIMEQRKLEDKIKLGEEQLKCLKDSLLLDQRLLY